MIEKKIERLLELQRKWINYGLASSEKSRVKISKIGMGWVVSFMGADEYGWSLEEALDNFIESLESDEDYVEARAEEEHLALEEMRYSQEEVL